MASRIFKSADALRAWGKQWARTLQLGDVVALEGPMGSGKTTLVQGLVSGWGGKKSVASPTFSIVNEYPTKKGLIFHMDTYRLTEPELKAFPFEEYWQEPALTLVEWADRLKGRFPPKTYRIRLSIPTPKTRRAEWSRL